MDAGETPLIITETSNPGNALTGFDFKSNFLRDEEGKEMKFNNFLPLLGYIQSIGWTVPDMENQIRQNMSTIVKGRSVFLLSKEVTEQEWKEWIENGKKKKK